MPNIPLLDQGPPQISTQGMGATITSLLSEKTGLKGREVLLKGWRGSLSCCSDCCFILF